MKVTRGSELEFKTSMERGKFSSRRKGLSPDGAKISCGLWELPPGKRSFPFHRHHVTEEALYVLSGRAKVRTPDGETPIGPGDWVTFPAGGVAHQLINDGAETLVYLGLSHNAVGADIVEYPDSGKVASSVVPPGGERKRFIFKANSQVDYFEGED
ncbi:MAG TPA: cupin domain-containing protein [Myxococcales bacterium]|nr:cupin domain-containing protein [Myxococcales bacterium]